jgi:hypothetical protein
MFTPRVENAETRASLALGGCCVAGGAHRHTPHCTHTGAPGTATRSCVGVARTAARAGPRVGLSGECCRCRADCGHTLLTAPRGSLQAPLRSLSVSRQQHNRQSVSVTRQTSQCSDGPIKTHRHPASEGAHPPRRSPWYTVYICGDGWDMHMGENHTHAHPGLSSRTRVRSAREHNSLDAQWLQSGPQSAQPDRIACHERFLTETYKVVDAPVRPLVLVANGEQLSGRSHAHMIMLVFRSHPFSYAGSADRVGGRGTKSDCARVTTSACGVGTTASRGWRGRVRRAACGGPSVAGRAWRAERS